MTTNLRDRAMEVLIAWGGGATGTNKRDRALRAVMNGLGVPSERGPGLSDDAYLAIIEHLGASGLKEKNLQNRAWEAVLQVLGDPGGDWSVWDRAYKSIIANGGLSALGVKLLIDESGNRFINQAGDRLAVRA